MVNLIELEPEGSENRDDDTPEYEEEELVDADDGILVTARFFIFLQNICININLLKYKPIFIVARRYAAKPAYGTYPIICTW
jgi:hypothetical protein